MDFIDQIKQLSQKVQRQKNLIKTEEATKNAFILPLIQALGYSFVRFLGGCTIIPSVVSIWRLNPLLGMVS
ncbi:hypothetical protein WA1_23940 [Scytonema hofmannii PCC 7110]|uniref:Uncharacterized protein n=1 Tax=Scytonema hofmannii PCC 7110 TaxID=128403 RepID=A0A139X7Q9_9CYAN|nr:hypothetical protein [Scytonema hofmannii]KYC40695.1 hypothetical protein WA1_23940 [Scytonema hofmannii PCC 7110]